MLLMLSMLLMLLLTLLMLLMLLISISYYRDVCVCQAVDRNHLYPVQN
jgi:hypothetical protein